MNKNFILIPVAACLAAGCAKAPVPAVAETDLTVNLAGLSATKSTDGTASENRIGNLTLFVFDAGGMLDVSHACTQAEIDAGRATLRIKTGTKVVYAVANMNEGLAARANAVVRQADLDAVPYALSDNGPSSLVMRGVSAAAPVTGSGGTATVSLARGVARVWLGSVRNNLPAPYGSVRVRHAFLCNVVGNRDLGGQAAPDPARYVNQEATRGHVQAQVIGTGSVEAECKELTFRSLGDDLAWNATRTYDQCFFYAFPNALTTPNQGFHAQFLPTATVLMVVVTIQGTDYYYPVPLSGGIAANTEYRVDLTLSGLGNTGDAPFIRIEKADLSANIRVSPWDTGAGISENI